MFGRILLMVILIPLIELALLSQLLLRTSFITTFIVVLLTGIIGVHLARKQGRQAWIAIQQQARNGKTPSAEIVDGVMILLAGAFLITPGLLTDTVGFLLLVPRCRIWLGAQLREWFAKKTFSSFRAEFRTNGVSASDFEDDETPQVRVIQPRKLQS